jgi:hypothetical protein
MKKLFSFIAFFLFLMFLINVSALGDKYTYNEIEKKAVIFDKSNNEIANVKLNTPEIFYVGAGYQKVAEFEATAKQDISSFIKQIKFYDRKNNNERLIRNFDLKYKTIEQISVDDFKLVCIPYTAKNFTLIENCTQEKAGSHLESIEVWNNFTDYNLKKDANYTIGIFTNVEKGDMVEWIPNFANMEITEWATWIESLNNELVAYYHLNETSGTTASEILNGINNGTTQNMEDGDWVPSLFGNGLNFGGTNEWLSIPTSQRNGESNLSVSFWFNTSSTASFEIIDEGSESLGQRYVIVVHSGINVYSAIYGIASFGAGNNSQNYSDGNWHHVVLTINQTQAVLYFDNSIVATLNNPSLNLDATGGLRIGKDIGSSNFYVGGIDEIAFWNRSLTLDEVNELYNNGTGIAHSTPALPTPLGINITLLSPNNDTLTNNNWIVLNSTINSTNGNLTNATFFIWNDSELVDSFFIVLNNSLQEQNVIHNFTNLNFGAYHWNTFGCAENSTDFLCEFYPENLTFFINFTAPVVTPSVERDSTYQVMASGGAGLGIFMQYLAQALPLLVLSLIVVTIIIIIGFSIVKPLRQAIAP